MVLILNQSVDSMNLPTFVFDYLLAQPVPISY